jgi:hypothetical protein
MKINMAMRSQAAMRWALLAALGLPSLLLPLGAAAALGGDMNTVTADQQQLRATRTVRTNDAKYAVHEITTSYGTVVREYVSPDGKVFGVAWRGPFLPDFQQIFGAYYQQFAQGAEASTNAGPRRSHNAPLTVQQPELVVHSAGHARAYSGFAYVPGLVPPGVDTKEIR